MSNVSAGTGPLYDHQLGGYADTAQKRAAPTMMEQIRSAVVRHSGRSMLLEQAAGLRRKAANLEALARAIPENFPSDADDALRTLVVSIKAY